jgi:hypothetical protein
MELFPIQPWSAVSSTTEYDDTIANRLLAITVAPHSSFSIVLKVVASTNSLHRRKSLRVLAMAASHGIALFGTIVAAGRTVQSQTRAQYGFERARQRKEPVLALRFCEIVSPKG